MDRAKASAEIMGLFIRAARKYHQLEKMPIRISSKYDLYHSERHMLDTIGDNPGLNVTEFANALGVTKGAVSQVVKKLEAKGVVRRYRNAATGKEVTLELTTAGREIFLKHKKTNLNTIRPLIEELHKYSDDEVRFLVDMFRWIDVFLDRSGAEMKEIHQK